MLKGTKHSNETKELMSKQRLGVKHTEKRKQNISKGMYRKWAKRKAIKENGLITFDMKLK